MDLLSPLTLAVSVAALFAGATVLSAAGFGMGMVALPFLLLVVDPVTAILALNTTQIPLYLVVLRDTHRDIHTAEVRPLALVGVAGAVLGVFALTASAEGFLRIGTIALTLDDGLVDLATGLAVLPDKLLAIWARMRRFIAACQEQRGRQGSALSAGQDPRWRTLGHGLFRLPVLLMHRRCPLAHPLGWGAIVSKAFGIEIAPQRIDHGRNQNHAAQSAIHCRGACRAGTGQA